ncbi:MAG: hypothetical protein M1550_04995 [Deltaproteobacteria bacterium]|nr:hypothetical protein [Deltaproteobacteria bacterium]
MGFGLPGKDLVEIRRRMDEGVRLEGGFNCDRAFKRGFRDGDLEKMRNSSEMIWGSEISVIDPMSGGGSIPLESTRLGFHTLANEYNPVACSVLEATVGYPFFFGEKIGKKARKWAKIWSERIEKRLAQFYPAYRFAKVHAYVFTRTVPCPDTQFHTPLVPDWHLLKPKTEHGRVVAEPIVDRKKGTWSVQVRPIGRGAGQIRQAPPPTYDDGKGVSLFSGQMVDGVWAGRQIPADYIKAKAQAGEMRNCLYAVALKAKGLTFQPPELADLKALEEAEKELGRLRPGWEKGNIIPTELYPEVSSDERPRLYGMPRWADMFSPRQLLSFGVLAEELKKLYVEVVRVEGKEEGEAVIHLLGFVLDKLMNYNSVLGSWHAPHAVMRSVFDRHDFSFKPTFAEMAACNAGGGFEWAIDSVLEAYEQVSELPHHPSSKPVEISLGSATSIPSVHDGTITAVVVDPPYADNVQYSELADFFYVWLKRTQGHRRPEWFSTYLCEHDQEAVVNITRHRENSRTPNKKSKRDGSSAEAKTKAHAFYQGLMTDVFRESRRILRDDGVLTVMFTHKKQEAWEALFTSLIQAGFTITATWPIKTESEHSLHQAKKNAAQSTVILVARKRPKEAGVGYFDNAMRREIREKARSTAERLEGEGLNPVDQLVGSFGPAMEVYSRHSEVRTDTGVPVGVDKAIDLAADAVSEWRVQKLSDRGLEGVESEGKFTLLCWDVLGAVEFRFNEAKLLGNAVGMDVDQLVAAGLVTKTGDKVQILSAGDRRRDKALEPDSVEVQTLFGPIVVAKKRASKKSALKVHPNDPAFRTALDACHALALRYIEAGGGAGGIGSAKSLANQQRWTKDSKEARLIEALVHAAPEAVRHEAGKKSVAAQYPEFRAWHALLLPLFGIKPPDWKKKLEAVIGLPFKETIEEEEESDSEEEG